MNGYLTYLIGSDLAQLSVAVALGFALVNAIGAFARTFIVPAITATMTPPVPTPPNVTNSLIAQNLLPSLVALAVVAVLACAYVWLRFRLVGVPPRRSNLSGSVRARRGRKRRESEA